MRGVSVYIEGQKLDLFDDEQIKVTSIQQNVQDINAVLTDFSQSFTVPASTNNNAIFNHFYQNDVSQTIDQNIRRAAFIEIDLTLFRRGKISLEKSEVKNNKPYSYQITFYGDVTSLKDTFGESKLADITTLTSTDFNYTSANVSQRITDDATEQPIRFPLIVGRNVTYEDGASTDISQTGSNSIAYNELFPAIAVFQIFNALQQLYSITFTGSFLNNERFRKAYLYCQNAENFIFYTSAKLIEFNNLSQDPNNANTTLLATDFFDSATDVLTLNPYNVADTFPPTLPANAEIVQALHEINVQITNFGSLDTITDVYRNGQLAYSYDTQNFSINILNENVNTNDQYQFFVRATDAVNLTVKITYRQRLTFISGTGAGSFFERNNFFTSLETVALDANFSVLSYMPDMKIVDFFKGILQMFNLTCYGTAENVFQVEPLDDWYSKGALVDITQYTDIKSTKIDRIKLFKNISFKYQQSECATNEAFRGLSGGREYGNRSALFPYDGGEYKIDLPFENMMMHKFTNADLQVGKRIKTDGSTYITKPLVMYQYNTTNAGWRFNEGSGVTNMSNYIPFGQDLLIGTTDVTLNFNADISTFLLIPVQDTLYRLYYEPYLFNLYNLKNRRTSVKTNLPISLLTSLQLNDRVIIRDKRFMIESMNSNLNTGDVELVLINDFKDLLADGGSSSDVIVPDNNAQCLFVDILFPNGVVSATVTTTSSGVTITPSTLTSEGRVEVCLPANGVTDLIVTEDGANNITTDEIGSQSTKQLRTEGLSDAGIILLVTYTFANGSTAASQILIQQQG